MFKGYRSLVVAVSGVLLLAACGKSEPPPPPPPPPKVEAPPPPANAGLARLASEVYVYAYPLVLMDVTRQVATAKAATNTLAHRRSFPDPATDAAVNPNPDVLISTAWLDLAKEPVVLSVPDTKGRYYLIALLDAWTNVFSSVGKRTIGTDKQDFAIVGPNWKGTLPKGLSELRSPTDMAWLVGRIEASGKDLAAVTKIQDQIKLAPLSQFTGHPLKSGKGAPPAAGVDLKTLPVDQVARMDAATFYTRFAQLLPGNPPSKGDAPMSAKIAKLGVVGGQPFTLDKLDPPSAKAIEDGVKTANAAIVTASKGSLGDLKNGWTTQWDLGRYGINYGYRAVAAMMNLGANAPEDAVFASTRFDAKGRPLTGANAYVLHFDKGKTPPVEAFWALSMYNDKNALDANPIDRHTLGSRDPLQVNPDGSIDIYVSHESPGKERQANWLPAPKGNFKLMLRIYWPKQEALDQHWTPPPVQPAT